MVTGGGQGIGRAITERLLQEGLSVVIGEIDQEAGEECVEALSALGEVHAVPTDVSDERAVKRLVSETQKRFKRLDYLVNNVGIAVNTSLDELSLEAWRRVLDTNLTAMFLTVKYAAPLLRQAKGAVVNIASTRALMSEPNTEAYAASKGGVLALTHALAMSLAPNVRVNALSPGWIEVRDWQKASTRQSVQHRLEDRAQHPVGRVGTPHDVASMVAYLLSQESGFVTGQNMVVDGGMTRKMIYQ